MTKLDKMTPEQEKLLPVYIDKWLKIGRSTMVPSKEKSIEAVKTIYRLAKLKEPEHLFFFPSPIQCQLAVNLLKSEEFKKLDLNLVNNLRNNLRNNLVNNLRNNLGNNLENNLGNNLVNNLVNNLWNNLVNNLRNNLENNLVNNLGNNLWNNLENNLGNNLENNLRNNLVNNLRNNLVNNLWNNLWNNLGNNLGNNLRNNKLSFESMYFGYWHQYWSGYYDFILNVLFPDKIDDHKDFTELCGAIKDVYSFIPFDNIVFISAPPEKLTLDTQGRLHGETEPAMMFQDGYSLFYLNGVQVPKWAIDTPKDDIQPKQVLELTNTEQRMALMRHVGLSRFMKDLEAEEIHEWNGSKLYYITVENQKVGPYLYLRCPSSGREFLEGVGNPDKHEFIDTTIKTCQDAHKWRAMKASQGLMTKFNLKFKAEA